MNIVRLQTKIILVGGNPRGGTTLLRNLLGSHPDLYCFDTEWLIYNVLPELRGFTGIFKIETVEDLERVFAKILIGHPYVKKWGLTPAEVGGFLHHYPASWDAVFPVMALAMARKHTPKIVVIKAPGLEAYFDTILKELSCSGFKPYFFYCFRSPAANYASHRKGWNPRTRRRLLDVVSWSSHWIDSVKRAADFRRRFPEKTALVRFEDLLAEPEARCRDLCKFLDIPEKAAEMVAMETFGANSSFDNQNLRVTEGKVLDLKSRPPVVLTDNERFWLTVCERTAADLGLPPAAVALGAEEHPSREGYQVPFWEQQLVMAKLSAPDLLKCVVLILKRRLWLLIRNRLLSRFWRR